MVARWRRYDFLARGLRATPDPRAGPDRAPDLAAPLALRFGAGAAARRSASSSIARCGEMDSMVSPLRSEALVSPSVTYGPKRPSRSTIGLPLAVSSPNSRSGGAAAARAARPRGFGWADHSFPPST